MNGVRVWKAQWRDESLVKRCRILGRCTDRSEAMARSDLDKILRPINEFVLSGSKTKHASRPVPITFQVLVEEHYYPYARKKWKEDSTKITTEQRINDHLIDELGGMHLSQFTRRGLQNFLDGKAQKKLDRTGRRPSFSLVDHLHRDLKVILKFAIDEGLLDGTNPAARLVTPREAVRPQRRKLERDQVGTYLMVLDLRERLIASLVLFSGFRPGEVFPLKLGDHLGAHIEVARRIYRGSLGTPKNHRSERPVGLAPGTLRLLQQWKDRLPDTCPEVWLFPSENPATPLSKDNCWRRHMLPRLETVGLGWANFHVLRRTHASLSSDCGIDRKLTADQMGHSVDVNANVYTQTYINRMIEAATRLETEVLGRANSAVEDREGERSEA